MMMVKDSEEERLASRVIEVITSPEFRLLGLSLQQIMWLRAEYSMRTGASADSIDPKNTPHVYAPGGRGLDVGGYGMDIEELVQTIERYSPEQSEVRRLCASLRQSWARAERYRAALEALLDCDDEDHYLDLHDRGRAALKETE